MRRITATLASALLGAGLALGSAAPAVATGDDSPGYYPYGPQRDVPISTLTDNGWTLCFSEHYNHWGTDMTDVQRACGGGYLIVTGRPVGASTLTLLAAAPAEGVFTVTELDEPRLVNGTYWYFTPGWSMGFSDIEEINQDSCDYGPYKDYALSLCWHMDYEADSRILQGGYLLGDICGDFCAIEANLNGSDGEDYLREIYSFTPACGELDAAICPTIAASGTTQVTGAPGTGYTTAYATYTWYRCGQPGPAVMSARPPVTCRKISSYRGSAAQMALRPYTITRQDVRAGYLRLAVKVLNTTYYSGAYSTAP